MQSELNALLACGPEAQIAIRNLLRELRTNGYRQSDITVQAIAKARTSAEGQAGLSAFFDKKPAPWVLKLPREMKPV